MSGPSRTTRAHRFLSRRALQELSALQESVRELAAQRASALSMFLASRHAATSLAQRDFWLEFSWADQEYRAAVRDLARFCSEHREGSRRTLRAPDPEIRQATRDR